MFCALLKSRYQVSVYRTNGPLVYYFHAPIFQDIVYTRVPSTVRIRNGLTVVTMIVNVSTCFRADMNVERSKSFWSPWSRVTRKPVTKTWPYSH